MRRVLAGGAPPHVSRHVGVQAGSSSESDREKPGTSYISWLFEPGTTDELVEDIYMHTLPLGILAAVQRAPTARVTWPQDDEIAARAVTAAVPQQGGVQ